MHLQNWGFHFLPGSYGNCEQPQRHVCLDVPILHDGHKQLRWDQDLTHHRHHHPTPPLIEAIKLLLCKRDLISTDI